MMKMGGENYVTNDDMLTRMSKCDNKVQDQYIIVVSDIQGGISASPVHHAPVNYWDDYDACNIHK